MGCIADLQRKQHYNGIIDGISEIESIDEEDNVEDDIQVAANTNEIPAFEESDKKGDIEDDTKVDIEDVVPAKKAEPQTDTVKPETQTPAPEEEKQALLPEFELVTPKLITEVQNMPNDDWSKFVHGHVLTEEQTRLI